MPVILPVIAILLLIDRRTIKESFLLSLVINAVFVAVSTEILSLFSALTLIGVMFAWAGFIICIFCTRKQLHRWFAVGSTQDDEPHCFASKSMLAVLTALIGLLGFVAVVAAPNNWDSLTYHLPRILHWIQNGSVAHYPTHITRQVTMPPWSEYAMMHLFLLSGGDRFVNCVQWLSLLGSCVGVMVIVRKLGGSLSHQYSAAVIAATLPIGLLEATSTQNDYALAVWCVAFIVYALDLMEKVTWQATLLSAASLALALMTKATGYIILFPIVVGALAVMAGRNAIKHLVVKFAVGALIVIVVNSGVFLRNWLVFGYPLTTDQDTIVNTSPDPRIAAVAVVRSIGTHLSSPMDSVNDVIFGFSSLVHKAVGIDPQDPRLVTGYSYRVSKYRNHEDYASNPVHMLLFLGALLAAFATRKKLDRRVLWYVAVVTGSFLSLSIMIRWNVWLSRYFIPVFILTAPAVVMSFRPYIHKHVAAFTLVMLAGIGFYITFTNETRPLSGHLSILKRTRIDQYFANAPDLPSYYQRKLARVVMSGQKNVALTKLNGDAWEYPVWVMLPMMTGKPFRIEHVNVQNRTNSIPLKEGFTSFTEVVL